MNTTTTLSFSTSINVLMFTYLILLFITVTCFCFKDGSSVLHLAANSGNTEIAPLLIHRGIAINLQNTVSCLHDVYKN